MLDGPRLAPRGRALAELFAAALALGLLYGINSWSYPVTAGVLALAVIGWLCDGRSHAARPAAIRWLLAAIALSALLVLPFHLSFDPAARGIGSWGRAAASPAGCATRCCSSARWPCSSRSPTSAGSR